MSWQARIQKLRAKLIDLFSPERNLRRLAYHAEKISLSGNEGIYEERSEYGPENLQTKLRRVEAGGPFEPLDVTLVNKLAVQLAGTPKNVLEVGSGTGMFSSMLARELPMSVIVASEFEDATRCWAIANRAHLNIDFCDRPLSDFKSDEFELSVALEVVEHVDDYRDFLLEMSRVAARSIISTPNKFRSPFDASRNSPSFDQHVREWSGGEFYWVLRIFWDDVRLYTMPSVTSQMKYLAKDPLYEPKSKETGVHCREHCMIAVCNSPWRPSRLG